MTIRARLRHPLGWALLGLVAGCTVPATDYSGKQCTQDVECGAPLACVNGACRQVLAQDDFSTYPPAVWADGTVVGPWSQAYGGDGGAQIVVDGAPVLLLATPLTTPTRAALALRAQVDAGIDFAVKMKVVGLVGSPSEVRVYWSYQGSSHLYALALDGQSWSLFEELAGSTKVPVLTQQGPLIPTGSWHTVGVLQRDDSATVFVDGVARGNAQFDAGYTGGQLGFYVQQAQSELATVVLAAP